MTEIVSVLIPVALVGAFLGYVFWSERTRERKEAASRAESAATQHVPEFYIANKNAVDQLAARHGIKPISTHNGWGLLISGEEKYDLREIMVAIMVDLNKSAPTA